MPDNPLVISSDDHFELNSHELSQDRDYLCEAGLY
jgi:hypothetical protein